VIMWAIMHVHSRWAGSQALLLVRLAYALPRMTGRGRQAPGQALVLTALLIPVLVALVLTFLEIGTRLLQRAEAEDALRHASRSAIQTFAYQPFAAGAAAVREADMLDVARSTFRINLDGVHGLLTTAAETAGSVSWQPVLAGTGRCSAWGAPAVEVAAPALCAEVELRMRGLTGWGEWRTRLFVVETLDHVR